jgi:predicted AAA+ superfamily ATPase
MARAVHGRHSRDYGRFAENAVYLELLSRGFEPGFFRGRKEIDFVAPTTDNIVHLVNVTMTDKIPKREFDGINEFIEKYPRSQTKPIILTDSLEDEVSEIKLIPLWKWLIREEYE